MIIRKLAAAIGAAGILITGLGMATAASASNGPTAVAGSSASTRGPTYVNMHTGRTTQSAYWEPLSFVLMGGRPSIFTTGTYWPGWRKYSAVGSGLMWGVRHGHRTYVGDVTLRFSDRKSNAYFVATGQRYSYFEDVRISGIRPGNGGSVQNWHWSWHAHNWLPNRR
jgi:hypothetical protein